MGLMDFFKKKKPEKPSFDPLKDLVLKKLKVGYLVDYDAKTFEVTGYNVYDYGGSRAEEWQLRAESETFYLEYSQEDGGSWSMSYGMDLNEISEDVRGAIIAETDPPDRITVSGKAFTMADASSGWLLKDGKSLGRREFVSYFYMDDKEEAFVTIMQWSGRNVDAVQGWFVEEYEFDNILPGQGV
jgi:hypothetical protein